ncbi:MAG: molybdate ABC transporter substrate-binding protein [Burkholderiales bacterium]|nr:molybdate ABC transporter substrate-binding protein [Burkholderiales bacterium]
MRCGLLRTRWLVGPLAAVLATAALAATPAADVQVAVAANFVKPLQAMAAGFRAATGHGLTIIPGATGKLYAQIVAGAPFEVLLAADQATPARLVAEGHAVAGSAYTYAIGRLALWSRQPGRVDPGGAVLAGGHFAHLAMANPRLAPYGAAAMQVLQARGLAAALAPKLVLGENIAQTFQFVASGNAELGFVALSQLRDPERLAGGSAWEVPQSLYRPIRQDAVLLTAGAADPGARALLAWLRSADARRVLVAYGYAP